MFFRVNPKFCVNAKLWCKIEQKYFKAGAAQAAAAFSTKITALRGDVKGGGVSLRSSRLLTFRLQPVSPACGRQRTPPTVRELRSSLAADVHGGGHMVGVLHTQHLLLAAGAGVAGSRLKYADLYDFFAGSGVRTALTAAAGIAGAVSAAGRQTHGHSQRQHDGNKLLHSIHPPCEIRTT